MLFRGRADGTMSFEKNPDAVSHEFLELFF